MATGINKMYDIDYDDFKQLQSLFISYTVIYRDNISHILR